MIAAQRTPPAGAGRKRRGVAGLALLTGCWATSLAGCGDFDPAVVADHDSPHYQVDLAACQTTGDTEADRRAKATFPMFVIYPISLPYEQRALISRCMAAKGYRERG